MINTKFEAYKLKREIRRSGSDFVFKRQKLNEFNEPSGEYEEVGSIKGLYHESNSYVTNTVGDAATTRTKKQPMLLCLYEDFVSLNPCQGDVIEIPLRDNQMTSKTLKYVGCVNILNWCLIADLSFEEVDEGGDSQIRLRSIEAQSEHE